MADATAEIMVQKAPMNREQIALTLTSGQKVYQNSLAAIAIGTGKVVNGTGGNPLLLVIGRFRRNYDASATGANADMPCLVDLARPINGFYLRNSTSTPVTQAYVGRVVYVQDNQYVTITPTSNSVAGVCWEISSTKGVLVEVLPVAVTSATTVAAPPVQVANTTVTTWAPTGASLVNRGVYLLNATTGFTGAATVTLPAAGVAAGTQINLILSAVGQTVTIKDETGATALTTALSATLRNHVIATNAGDSTTAVWVVNGFPNAS